MEQDDDASVAQSMVDYVDDRPTAVVLRDAEFAANDDDAHNALANFIQSHFLAYVDHIAHFLARKSGNVVVSFVLVFFCFVFKII